MKKKTKIVGLFLMITLLFFAIPGFGKVQASREDDVFDGWQELEDEGKTIIEVDNAAFADHFKDFAATNYPEFADWVERIAAMDPANG